MSDVKCPSGQRVKKGESFTCSVNLGGQDQKVTVTFIDDDGKYESRARADRSAPAQRLRQPAHRAPMPSSSTSASSASGSAGSDGRVSGPLSIVAASVRTHTTVRAFSR